MLRCRRGASAAGSSPSTKLRNPPILRSIPSLVDASPTVYSHSANPFHEENSQPPLPVPARLYLHTSSFIIQRRGGYPLADGASIPLYSFTPFQKKKKKSIFSNSHWLLSRKKFRSILKFSFFKKKKNIYTYLFSPIQKYLFPARKSEFK